MCVNVHVYTVNVGCMYVTVWGVNESRNCVSVNVQMFQCVYGYVTVGMQVSVGYVYVTMCAEGTGMCVHV